MNVGKVCTCGCRLIIKFMGYDYYSCTRCGKKYNIKYTKEDVAYFDSIEDNPDKSRIKRKRLNKKRR